MRKSTIPTRPAVSRPVDLMRSEKRQEEPDIEEKIPSQVLETEKIFKPSKSTLTGSRLDL